MENAFLLVQLGPNTGRGTMRILRADCEWKGHTWFCTDCYIREDKARQYSSLLFMVDGEIRYRAEMTEFHSSRLKKRRCPVPDDAPDEWLNEEARTWMKFRDLAPENEITLSRLKFIDSGNVITRPFRNCLHYVALKEYVTA